MGLTALSVLGRVGARGSEAVDVDGEGQKGQPDLGCATLASQTSKVRKCSASVFCDFGL